MISFSDCADRLHFWALSLQRQKHDPSKTDNGKEALTITDTKDILEIVKKVIEILIDVLD